VISSPQQLMMACEAHCGLAESQMIRPEYLSALFFFFFFMLSLPACPLLPTPGRATRSRWALPFSQRGRRRSWLDESFATRVSMQA